MIKSFFILSAVLLTTLVLGQEDTAKMIELEVVDSLQKEGNTLLTILRSADFTPNLTNDLSTIISWNSNIAIKDYGGAGGLKTISIRGFGAEHTGVAINGVSVIPGQTGAVNLGAFRMDQIAEVDLQVGATSDFPNARSVSFVGGINLIPKVIQAPKQNVDFELYSAFSSFATLESSLGTRFKLGNRTYLGWNSSFLYSKGDFPFQNWSGEEEKRENSNVYMSNVLLGGGTSWKSGKLTFLGQYNLSNKELPGAVIAFDFSNSEQKLKEDAVLAQVVIHQNWKKVDFRGHIQYNYANTQYSDPNFFE